jgi:glycine oxidase
VLAATGHSRNGILLAPITADAILAQLRGDDVAAPLRAADPARSRAQSGGM